ncbi:PAS domain S-box protein [Flavobacterium soyangense]|uniref:histidine kinase n=1 Tax=Flavobacterium soyangense TaxID=2023265 RepID=A0A930UBJ8_9FLAO|nr:PAS domain S-box protein [Flavobacterium soyangense]MBF2709055.1 PAS domain S-box protein [Flavobacterium soyangense]
MKKEKLTYDELLKITKDQELEINYLLKKELLMTNLDFYFKESSDLVCIAGTDGFYKEINPAFIKILGYTKEELLSLPITTFICPDDKEKSEKEIETLSLGINSLNFENRLIKKNGEIVFIQWTTSVDAAKEIIYAIGRDITENKQIRKELNIRKQAETDIKLIKEKGNHKFESYIKNAPDGIFVADENGKFIEVNYALTLISGYSKEELLTLSMKDLTYQESYDDLNVCFNRLKEIGKSKGEFKTIQKSGEIKWSTVDSVKLSDTRFLGFIKDITEIKSANELLTNTFDRITDAFVALDNNWCYTYMNKKAGEIFGCNPKEIIGKHIWTEFPEGIDKPFYNTYYQAINDQKYIYLEEHYEPYNLWFENHIYPSSNGLSIFFRDITEEKTAKNKIEESEKRFRALVENNNGVITVVDENRKVLFRSPSSARITGYSNKELDEISDNDYFHPDYLGYVFQLVQKTIKSPGKPFPALFQVKHKQGHYIWLEGVLNNRLHDPSINGIIANFRDVTDRIESEAILKKERDFFANIVATSSDLIYSMVMNPDGSICFPYAGDSIKEIYGFSFEEIKNSSNKIFELIHPDDIDEINAKIIKTKTTLVPFKGVYRYFHPKKGLVWHEVNSLPVVEPDGSVISHGIVTDITERIEAKQKLLKANRLYLFISQINQMIVRTNDQETLFREACNIAVDLGKFKMAWIGLIDPATNNVFPAMITGDDQKYFEIIKKITTDKNTTGGSEPAGTAAREGVYCVCNDVENDLKMAPWKEEALKRGFQSVMSFPIKKFGNVIGIFTFYAGEKNFFDDEEIALLDEATEDVAFALELFDKEILREKAEREVSESELRYHTLTEVSPVGIFRTDAKGQTTFVNKSWAKISGMSFQQALGYGWLDAVHKDDKQGIVDGWKNATYTGDKSLSEYRFVRPDGSIAWIMGQAIPEKNKKNEIIGYIGTVTDITERKQAEDNIKNMHEKIKAILEAIPDALFEVDIDGLIYNYHSNQNILSSKSTNAFVGKAISEILPPDAAELFLSAVKEAAEKGFSNGKQYKLQHLNETHWFELSIAPMAESDDHEIHFICLTRNITKAKEADSALLKSKQRYRGLLSSLDAAIIVHASDTSIIMSNKKASKFLGLKQNKILGKTAFDPLWKFINEDNSPLLIDQYPVNQIIKTKLPLKNFTIGIKRPKKKKIVWVNINGFPMLDNNKDISEIVISFIDITERKQMEIEIKKAKVLAETANKAKTDFLANMSHEIRTPLNGIIGFTHLLMKSNLENNQLEYMSTINESATSLLHIVNDVLDFSKIESGKLELNIDELNLLDLINQVIHLFKYQADKKDIKLILTIGDNVPEYIYGDSVRLKQVFVNLLSNALKFTNFGEIRFDITETSRFEDECMLVFSVKDTGIGIQPNNNEKIFSSFVQEDNSTSRKFGGTGLGLSISNQLLALMGSKLELKSVYGEGSDFFFSIKLKKSHFNQNHDPKLDNSMNEITAIEILSNKKILIVEDNKINMFLAKTLVKRIIPNSIIIEASDGNEAIKHYINDKPDIILMDIQMPNKNGYEATNEIRDMEGLEKTPIIALTAGILIDEKEKCFESGMDDFLAKPIIVSDLEKTLLKWLVK